jgi:hypothetical protein
MNGQGGRLLCERHGCKLALIPGPEAAQRVFDITGLTSMLPFGAREHALEES